MRAALFQFVASLLLLSLLRVSAAAESRPPLAAQVAAEAWFTLVDAGKADESWRALAAPTRESIGRWTWKLSFATAQGQFGKVTSRTLRSAQATTRSPGGRNGEFVLLEYDSQSSKKGVVTEQLTMTHEADGQWRVGGYTARLKTPS